MTLVRTVLAEKAEEQAVLPPFWGGSTFCDAVRDFDGGQPAATIKCVSTDTGDAVRDFYVGQPMATGKCGSGDARDAVWDSY